MIAHTLIIILGRVDRHLGYIKKLRSQLPKKVREHEMLVVFRNLRIGSLYG
jgi:hypothetical protein